VIATADEQPVIARLKTQLEKGHELLKAPVLRTGHVQLWLGPIRHQLKRLYGPGVDVYEIVPKVEGNLADDELRRVVNLRIRQLKMLILLLENAHRRAFGIGSGRVFIGHGRSPVWRVVKDFISDRLKLPCVEFDTEAAAGFTTSERLHQLQTAASFAFLIMTAEDQHADSTMHARENVIHEVGLFQGSLSKERAIVLLEEGCQEFSNIHGLTQIRFPKHHVTAAFEEIRRVLEREGIYRLNNTGEAQF